MPGGWGGSGTASDRDAGSLGAATRAHVPGPLAHRRGLPVLLLLFLIFIARLPLGQLAGGQAPPLEERHNTHSEGPGGSWHITGTVTDPNPGPVPPRTHHRLTGARGRGNGPRAPLAGNPRGRPRPAPSGLAKRAPSGTAPIDPLGAPRREGAAKKCNSLLLNIYKSGVKWRCSNGR